MSEGDVRARPRVAPKSYREAACQYHSRTISGPMEPLTALRIPPAHVTSVSCPRHVKSASRQRPARHCSDLSATSPIHADHSQATTSRFRTRPHLMTSSKKRVNAQNVHIFAKIRVFSHFFTKSLLCSLHVIYDHFAATLQKSI